MKKIELSQVIFLLIIAVVLTYIFTGFLTFYFNDISVLTFKETFSFDFTYHALVKSYPRVYESLGYSSLVSLFIVAIIPFIPMPETALHGKARFATFSEIKNKMNLLGEKGLIIGKYKGKFLRFSGQQFVALGAPTRSGKGVGIVIPNLLDWDESCVVQDIKQECFDYTSKYRKEILKQEVYLFNPFSNRTHRYNPLTYIDMNDKLNRDSQLDDFAKILYPEIGNETSIFFNQQAQNLFKGLCYLYLDLSSEDGKKFLEQFNLKISFTLSGILDLARGFKLENENDVGEIEVSTGLEQTVEFLEYADLISIYTKKKLQDYLGIESANTKSGVESSFKAPLLQFDDEPMKTATSESDFDIRELRKKRMTIYIGITPDKLPNSKTILNIFWSQLILLNTKELPQKNKDLKYSCLLLMDEFTAIGNMPILQKAVSFIAGYNLRLMMIFQSISQLETPAPDGYGREGAKTLLTNHACQIFYAPRELEDAEKISKLLGTKTVKQVSRSQNFGKGLTDGSSSASTSETHRALMMPQELREMPFESELVTIDSGKPILCDKAFYYSDTYFMNKYKQIAPSLKNIAGVPDRKVFENAILNNETNINIPIQKGDY